MNYAALYEVTINDDPIAPVGADTPAEAATLAEKQWVLNDPEHNKPLAIRSVYVKKLATLERIVTKETIDYGRRKKR
jgi:hypothetical protein